MKVLMLGWEFPPHISGGLGTACAGLTQALEKRDIHILFVVPRLFGGEQVTRTTFISASTIPIPSLRSFRETPLHPSPSATHKRKSRTTTTVEVESFLTAYPESTTLSEIRHLRQWNYSLLTERHNPLPDRLHRRHPPDATQDFNEPYAFSGGYGPNLLEEVDRYAEAVVAIARNNTFDVIHAHDWMTYRAGMEAGRVSGKPLIVHVHATEIDRSGMQSNPVIFEIEKQGMLGADKVVTVSQWTKDIVIRNYHVPEEQIEVVHNGIDPRDTTSLTGAPVWLSDTPIVTFLGRVTHQKGPMYFVEAARKVLERFPDTHFVVAGAGEQLPLMIERIAGLRLSNHFHFTGFLKGPEVDRIWAASSVYVMPSVSEPFGITPLEAVQAGVPVILSRQAGVGEVMPHAIKVDFWNTEAFAEAICNVLRFRSLANTLKQNGAEAIKHITWEKAASKLTTLYHELSIKQQKRKKPDSLFSSTPAKTVEHTPVL